MTPICRGHERLLYRAFPLRLQLGEHFEIL